MRTRTHRFACQVKKLIDLDAEKFKFWLSAEATASIEATGEAISTQLADLYVFATEVKLAETLLSNPKADILKKLVRAEVNKMSKSSKNWGVNIKARLFSALREEMDSIILSA